MGGQHPFNLGTIGALVEGNGEVADNLAAEFRERFQQRRHV
jgi:hypothetical protein